jgi:linoleoyl-CoA desaturase
VLADLRGVQHPGGQDFWALVDGADATELFDCYHWRSGSRAKAWALLLRCAVGPAAQQPPPLCQLQAEWHAAARSFALEHGPLYMCSGSWALGLLALAFQCCCAWHFFLLRPLGALWGLGCMLTGLRFSHDGSHGAVSPRPWLNSAAALTATPWVSVPGHWLHNHVKQHHVHTNESKDPDAGHAEPLLRWHATRPWKLHHSRLSWACSTAFTFCITNLLFASPAPAVRLALCDCRYQAVVRRYFLRDSFHYACWIWCLTWPLFWAPRASLGRGLGLLIPNIVATSVYFMCVTQVSHIQAKCRPDQSSSWMANQVQTTQDYLPESRVANFVTGGLNLQSVHHCLPNVHNAWLPQLYPLLLRVLKSQGCDVHAPATSWRQPFREMLAYEAYLNVASEAKVEEPGPAPCLQQDRAGTMSQLRYRK